MAFVLGGLNFTTRDYARFGQMILQNGEYGGKQVVPADAQEGEFFERSIYGQYIYFDQPRGVMITTTGTDRLFREPGVAEANIDMFRKIAQGL